MNDNWRGVAVLLAIALVTAALMWMGWVNPHGCNPYGVPWLC